MDRYCLPDEYRARHDPAHHNDISFSDQFQREVYEFARDLMMSKHLRSVLDVGCGSGYKLVTYLGEFEITGLETEPCLSYLHQTYPNRRWRESGEPSRSFANDVAGPYDLIICADVIEHMIEPEALIAYIRSIPSTYALFSTPDREILATHSPWNAPIEGPPVNSAHVREWTFEEFKRFLEKHFIVVESRHGAAQIECQYHLCEPRS